MQENGQAKIGLYCRTQFTRDLEKKMVCIVEMCFGASWLDATAENDAEGRTNREVQTAVSDVMIDETELIHNTPQAIYGTLGLDTHPETNGSHLADVGWVYTSCASGTSRSNIKNDPKGGDPDWR
jgi:hypothetical protein